MTSSDVCFVIRVSSHCFTSMRQTIFSSSNYAY
jgi:hypothetical protein